MNSKLSLDLIRAYRETEYKVFDTPPFTLTIEEYSTELQKLYARDKLNSYAFITAWNPYSQKQCEVKNKIDQSALKSYVNLKGYKFLDGLGEHPSKNWPGEESFLILDISLEDAMEMGVLFKQNAIVWSDSDCIPQLIIL